MSKRQIAEFRERLQEHASERSLPTAHGVARLLDSCRDVYDSNFLWVDAPAVGAGTLAAEADAVLESRHHRRVVVHDGPPGLPPEFEELGYDLSTHLVLAHERDPDRRVDTSAVREVGLDDVAAAHMAATMAEPWGDDDIATQLLTARRRVAASIATRFFAAYSGDEVAGWCELYSSDEVTQIENVEVLPPFRGCGLGRALVQHALDEAGDGVVFLDALADDWPRELYRRLGFVTVDRLDYYTRLPHPLTRLRLRTPRLELRLPTVAELRELYAVASAGIHDPREMPFEVPWTDSLNEPGFLAYHQARRELAVFYEGRPIGIQGLKVTLPSVQTGSWLGGAYQGNGLGTEMRAAVLTLAFEHLGAETAYSGASVRNPQSLGVSRKLGYTVTGSRTFAPRGEPIEHTDLELRREDFRSPVAVDVHAPRDLVKLFTE